MLRAMPPGNCSSRPGPASGSAAPARAGDRAGLRYRVLPPLGRYPADGVRSPQRPVRRRATHQGKAFPLRAPGILSASRRQTWSSLHAERRQAPSFSSTPFEIPEKQSFLRRADCNLFAHAHHCLLCSLQWTPCLGSYPALFHQQPDRRRQTAFWKRMPVGFCRREQDLRPATPSLAT